MGMFDKYLGGWGNVLAGVGSGLNKATGATQAANLQQKYNLINGAVNQKYALQSAAINNAYQKEFAQNAHQWEIEDLKKAGLNPVLSAGGSGTGASGGGVSSGSISGSGIATAGINPIDVILNGVSTMTTAKRTNAETRNIDQDALLKTAQILLVGKQAATQESTKKEIDNKIKKITEEINLIQGGKAAQIFGTSLGNELAKPTLKKEANIWGELLKGYISKGGKNEQHGTQRARNGWKWL